MAWIQDDIKEISISMGVEELQGIAKINEVIKVAPSGDPKPGDTLVCQATIQNMGETDNIRLVGLILDANHNELPLAQSSDQVMHLEHYGGFGLPIVCNIPTDYSGDKIYVLATGFHEK